jgi:hypothetical protein
MGGLIGLRYILESYILPWPLGVTGSWIDDLISLYTVVRLRKDHRLERENKIRILILPNRWSFAKSSVPGPSELLFCIDPASPQSSMLSPSLFDV